MGAIATPRTIGATARGRLVAAAVILAMAPHLIGPYAQALALAYANTGASQFQSILIASICAIGGASGDEDDGGSSQSCFHCPVCKAPPAGAGNANPFLAPTKARHGLTALDAAPPRNAPSNPWRRPRAPPLAA